MAYSSGGDIEASDYNGFANTINTIWGTGSGASGYGQTTTLSTVSVGGSVTATQWANLFTRVTSIANHQGTTITALTNPSVGDTITFLTNLSANITSLSTNKLNAASNGTDATSTQDGTGTWTTSTVHEFSVDFGSDAQARYYFNAGGNLRISSSRSGGTSNDKNTEWTDLCTKIGTIVITSGGGDALINGTTYSGTDKVGGSGTVTTLNDNFGFLDSTTSYTTIFKQFADTSPYTTNYILIDLKDDGAGLVSVKVTYQDDATDTGDPAFPLPGTNPGSLDQVDGTLTTTLVARPPESTYLTDTWGSDPTVTSTNTQS